MPLKYTAKLEGQRILLLGGTSGIGFCIAESAVEQGATVILAGSTQSKIDNKIQELETSYATARGRVSGKTCDLSNLHEQEENLIALLEFATANKAEKLDHIVTTAGDRLYNPAFTDLTVDIIQQAQTVRFIAPAMLCKHAATYVKNAPSSSLTFTSGDGTYRPSQGWTLMPIVGAMLDGLARAAAVGLAPIRVNVVAPGATMTEFWGQGKKLPEEKAKELNERMAQGFLTGEVGRPEDVSEAYLYFIKNRNVTGTTNVTDGGKFFR